MNKLRQLLYVSRLAEGHDASAVGRILSTARMNNSIHGETGVLVFDGERFCQLLEGPTGAIKKLLQNLLSDERHEDVRILSDVPVAKRHFLDFRMGYCEIEGVTQIQQVSERVAIQAVDIFFEMVAGSDVET